MQCWLDGQALATGLAPMQLVLGAQILLAQHRAVVQGARIRLTEGVLVLGALIPREQQGMLEQGVLAQEALVQRALVQRALVQLVLIQRKQ